MDVSPSGIRKVQFREKLRGYHPEDVDAFVAEVANRVQALEQQLAAATARAEQAEATSAESVGNEEQLRRTLVLAQRTADLAVQEARDEAARIVAEAEARRDAALAEAAETERRAVEEARRSATDELSRYVQAREDLAADVRALDEYLREQRTRLLSELRESEERIEQRLYLEQPPDLHDVTVPPPADPAFEAPNPAIPADVDAPGGPADVGPAAATATDAATADDDAFLAELRRAVTDTEPLGPREAATGGRADGADDDLFEGGPDEGRSRLPWRR